MNDIFITFTFRSYLKLPNSSCGQLEKIPNSKHQISVKSRKNTSELEFGICSKEVRPFYYQNTEVSASTDSSVKFKFNN